LHNTETHKEALKKKRPDLSLVGEYFNCSRPILHSCNVCGGIWNVSPTRVLHENGKCPNCKLMKRVKRYTERLKIEHPNIVCIGEYVDFITHTLHQCTVCGKKWMGTPNSIFSSGHACRGPK
jgi:hypothetical protein